MCAPCTPQEGKNFVVVSGDIDIPAFYGAHFSWLIRCLRWWWSSSTSGASSGAKATPELHCAVDGIANVAEAAKELVRIRTCQTTKSRRRQGRATTKVCIANCVMRTLTDTDTTGRAITGKRTLGNGSHLGWL